jgi:outer membrane autotransporter protein
LGVRFRKTWLLKNGGRLTPQLKLAWRHDFSDEVVNTARLAGANASFKTTGIDVVSDIFNLGLGVDWKIDNAKTFYTQYDAEFGTRFKAHTLQAGVKILF